MLQLQIPTEHQVFNNNKYSHEHLLNPVFVLHEGSVPEPFKALSSARPFYQDFEIFQRHAIKLAEIIPRFEILSLKEKTNYIQMHFSFSIIRLEHGKRAVWTGNLFNKKMS